MVFQSLFFFSMDLLFFCLCQQPLLWSLSAYTIATAFNAPTFMTWVPLIFLLGCESFLWYGTSDIIPLSLAPFLLFIAHIRTGWYITPVYYASILFVALYLQQIAINYRIAHQITSPYTFTIVIVTLAVLKFVIVSTQVVSLKSSGKLDNRL